MVWGGEQQVAHVVPLGDLVGHCVDVHGECVCGPAVVAVPAGGADWVYVHHSLDGREFAEGDRGGA